MTSLANQLKRLALPQTDPSLVYRKQVASLLFEPKEAAVVDRDTFFAIGCTGLDELMGIDSSFKAFEETLFSSTSKNLERSVQTKAINQQLDENISLFLIHLSPYFMLKPAQKCLEWLIHRFHIHLYNQDNLIGCVLPYHETRMFVRVIQLLKISNPTHKWHWLHSIQKQGVPLARSTLITRCYADMDFMEFICNLVTTSVKEFSNLKGSTAKLRILMSFFVASIVAALDVACNVSDMVVAKLLPYIQKGLKTSLVEYKSSTFIIICQLAKKSIMEPTLVTSLATLVSRTLLKTPSLLREGVGCMIILLQNQQSSDVGKKPFIHLCKVPDLVSVLKEISCLFDTSSLLEYLLQNLVSIILSEGDNDAACPLVCKAHLEAIIHNITLDTDVSEMLARAFLDEFLSFGERYLKDTNKVTELGKRILPLIRLLETKYPQALDIVLEKKMKNALIHEEKDLLHQFIALSTSGGKHELLADCDTSLLLSLNHAKPAVRQLAILHLNNIIATAKAGYDESFLREAIIARLMDDNSNVVLSALTSLKIYHSHFTTDQTVSNLLNLFYRTDVSKDGSWCKVLEEAAILITQNKSIVDNPQLCNKVMMAVIPYLLFTNGNVNSAEHHMAVTLGKSSICSLHPMLKGWKKALGDRLQKAKRENPFTALNMDFTHLLSSNMTEMDPSSLLNMVEQLVQVLERKNVSRRQKVTFYVLSHALVEGYSQCQDPGLQIAKTIFELLDKKLRRLESSTQIEDKWTLEHTSGEQLHKLVLAKYIDKLNAEQGTDMEEFVLLMLRLKIFMESLRCPESFPRGGLWWNPETIDQVSRNYLQVLVGFFDVIVWGTSDGKHVVSFGTLLGILFKEHLKDPIDIFCFLSLLWTYCYDLGRFLDCTFNAVLQTQALYVGQILLASAATANENMLMQISSPVVVSLLINLTSPIKEVRKAAVACLNVLSILKDFPLSPVVHGVMERTEEIVADPTYVSQILFNLFENANIPGSSIAERNLSNALDQLLCLLETTNCPSYVGKVLLLALRDVNGEGVLGQLLPLLERLLEKVTNHTTEMMQYRQIDDALLINLILKKFNKYSAAFLSKHQQSLDIFVQVLKNPQTIHRGISSFQIVALRQINKEFFSAIDDGCVQQKLLGVMFDLLLNQKSTACSQAITSAFKSISINAGQISAELEPPRREKCKPTLRQARRIKLQTIQKKSKADTQEDDDMNWPRVTIILELLQHKKKLAEPQLLVPTLFYLLSRCLETSNLEQENIEYIKQLILSCLHNICQKMFSHNEKNAKDILDEEKFNVELIVQCVRTSEMPQTHHHALLLLGTAAGIFPDKVLHNIMPIFTFMGASVMRLDDSYSFQVINKTVQTVIPSLIQAGKESSKETKDDVEKVFQKIIHVFVDALPHVPEHRRLPILSHLLELVGVSRFLWELLVLFFEQHVSKSVEKNGEKDATLEQDTDFWMTVCCEFSVCNQLESVIKLLKFLTKLPENNNEGLLQQTKGKTHKHKAQKQDFELFGLENYSAKQLRHFKFLSVSFITQLLASNCFVSKVVKCEAAKDLKSLEQRLLEEVLCYINLIVSSAEESSGKPTEKFWRALLNKTYELLDKVNALLPTERFIPVLRGLLSNQLPSVRRKALDILNNKLQHQAQWQEEQIELLLGLVKDLLFVAQQNYTVEEEELAINRQTALYSLQLLCKYFGSQRQQVFVPVINVIVDIIIEGPKEKNLLGSAFLCIAEITSTIKALAIPQLPRLMPALLTILKQKNELLTSEVHLLSIMTALQKVLETLPHFISPYLYESLVQVTLLDKDPVKFGPTSQISSKIASLKTTLSTKLTARVLLPAISKCYCRLVDINRQQCISSLMDILREHIDTMEKLQISVHQSELTSFFLKALDYRVEHSVIDLREVGNIEGDIINCLVTMVIKLSEATFRPLFFKLFDWSRTESASKERLITFYRLVDCIADKLKGLFTLFAGHLIKPLANILNQTNTIKTDEALFESDNSEKSCLLLEYVLNCLHKIFLYDTKHFLSKERADALMMPLLDQIENLLGGDEKFQSRVNKILVPCIAQFSVAMADDSLWKPLNYQILLKMRHSSAKVRFAALLVIVDFAEKLRENYLALLPESIPFLAELMEDECLEVENQSQKTIKQLENILGESLQSYF